MEPPQSLYDQNVTQLAMPFFLRKETEVSGRLMLDLVNTFTSTLVFPGCRLKSLDTKRPEMGRKLNMGEFTDRRWNAAVKKILANQYAVVGIRAETPDFPNQKIWLTLHVNPPGGDESLVSGEIQIKCSISYLRHLGSRPQMVESLLQFGREAWNGIDGGPAYGFANLAMLLARPPFNLAAPPGPGNPLPWEFVKPPPADRAHAVPVAYVGNDIDGNLSGSYVSGRGIKGAFWANYLAAGHVEMAGGEQAIRTKLPGIRVEKLAHGGLLVVATDSPLPDDTEETRERFLLVYRALRPAFLSREQRTDLQKPLLSYFYRERIDPWTA